MFNADMVPTTLYKRYCLFEDDWQLHAAQQPVLLYIMITRTVLKFYRELLEVFIFLEI